MEETAEFEFNNIGLVWERMLPMFALSRGLKYLVRSFVRASYTWLEKCYFSSAIIEVASLSRHYISRNP